MTKSPTIKPAIDRIPVDGGGALCARCAVPMQRFCRPEGYTPNDRAAMRSHAR
jgi:hypothetical protein